MGLLGCYLFIEDLILGDGVGGRGHVGGLA